MRAAKRHLARVSSVVLVGALLGACSTVEGWLPNGSEEAGQPVETSAAPQADDRLDPKERLVQAAEKSAEAAAVLSRIEQARRAPAPIDIASPPHELRQPVSIEYTGPLDNLVHKLALRAGYSFRVIGKPPATGVIVDVVARGRPVYKVLQDAGLQAGAKALVAVNIELGSVEVRYER